MCGSHYEKHRLANGVAPRHTITDIDEENKTGTCRICGPNTRIWIVAASRGRSARGRCSNIPRVRKPNRTAYKYAGNQLISVEEAEKARAELMEKQKGKCAICGHGEESQSRRLHLDHCHTTGKIRGLLCHRCNTGIGQLREDVKILKAATAYLTR